MNLPSLPTLMKLFLAASFSLLTLVVGAARGSAQDAPPPAAPDTAAPAPAGDAAATAVSDTEDPADSRATGFRAVDGAITEDVPGGLMLVGAYGVIGALLLLFLFRQQSQLRELDGRIASLRAEIERGASQPDERG